jgi:hypothetical protein
MVELGALEGKPVVGRNFVIEVGRASTGLAEEDEEEDKDEDEVDVVCCR